jgi:hypothetical protein
MTTPNDKNESDNHRSSAWAAPVSQLKVSGLNPDVMNINVEGRQLTSPLNGFGQMWQKTYRTTLTGAQVTPQQVIQVWKDDFSSFWPKGNHFLGRSVGIAPGEVALLHLSGPGGINAPGGRPMISTGIMVVYVDEESFSFMTPQGHMFAAIITFSSYQDQQDIIAQVQALVRASDPFYEMVCRLGLGHSMEDDFWKATLANLGAHFNAPGKVEYTRLLVDPRMQWGAAKNVWHNAAIRTTLYELMTPFRWFAGLFKRRQIL